MTIGPQWGDPHSRPHRRQLQCRLFSLSSLCILQPPPRTHCIKDQSVIYCLVITVRSSNFSDSAPGWNGSKRQPKSLKSLVDFLLFGRFFFLYFEITYSRIVKEWFVILFSYASSSGLHPCEKQSSRKCCSAAAPLRAEQGPCEPSEDVVRKFGEQ